MLRKLGFQSCGLAIAADADGDGPSRWDLANHAPQLLNTFHLLVIDADNNVVLFDPRFACWRILVNHRDLNSTFFVEMKLAQTVGSHVPRIDPKIGPAPGLLSIKDVWPGATLRRNSARHRCRSQHHQYECNYF